ncbi:MAG: M28 family peptidase [Gammaproteobacteria bacterium]|nr:M28 family peptidase [Gammaproteobacteria bacterium]
MTIPLRLTPLLFLAGLIACSPPPEQAASTQRPSLPATVAISAEQIAEDIRTLASDEFEGRAPSSRGEELTIAFLQQRFADMGVGPGNGESYLQQVPLVSITAEEVSDMEVVAAQAQQPLSFEYRRDMMAWTRRVVPESALSDSELVFVGYGITAPEYDWDDYAGLDVRGKTVIIMVNDPGFATGDETLFNGRAMTYYGRWTYKYEEATRRGAAGALIVHNSAAAGYPWAVVSGSWSGPQFDLISADGNAGLPAIEGWLTEAAATELFAASDLDYASLAAKASTREFQPVALAGSHASVRVSNRVRSSVSNNVIARIEGSHYPDETIIYMAHWDHLGKDERLEDNQVFNGAIDNATGTAGLLAIAEAFATLETPPERSIVFLALTAEEAGLHGSAYYVNNPVYPLATTVAAINMDAMRSVWGPTHDLIVVGKGASALEDHLARAAAVKSRTLVGEAQPEQGMFYRSDHFNFAKAGVPSLYTSGGIDHVERGREFGLARRQEYTQLHYHKVTDEFDPDWDFSGIVDELEINFLVGHGLSMSREFPNWYEGNEFRAARDASAAQRAARLQGE